MMNRNITAGVGTFTSLDVPPTVVSFSTADGATNIDTETNISGYFQY